MTDIHLQADALENLPNQYVAAIRVVKVGPENTRTDVGIAWIGDRSHLMRRAAENEAAEYATEMFSWLLNQKEGI